LFTQNEIILQKINFLVEKFGKNYDNMEIAELFFGTLTLASKVYGDNSNAVNTIIEFKEEFIKDNYWRDGASRSIRDTLMGLLLNLKLDIESGFIDSLEKIISGELFGDFISLAKNIFEDSKDVACVLACAALEDALKKFARLNNLQVDNKEMSEVINALKSNSLIGGPQASIITAYTKLRNKAFHAEWDKIEKPEVQSLISFTEGFIIKYF
jgi:hypothetical protein